MPSDEKSSTVDLSLDDGNHQSFLPVYSMASEGYLSGEEYEINENEVPLSEQTNSSSVDESMLAL